MELADTLNLTIDPASFTSCDVALKIQETRRPAQPGPSKKGPIIDGEWLETFFCMFLGFHFLRPSAIGRSGSWILLSHDENLLT